MRIKIFKQTPIKFFVSVCIEFKLHFNNKRHNLIIILIPSQLKCDTTTEN